MDITKPVNIGANGNKYVDAVIASFDVAHCGAALDFAGIDCVGEKNSDAPCIYFLNSSHVRKQGCSGQISFKAPGFGQGEQVLTLDFHHVTHIEQQVPPIAAAGSVIAASAFPTATSALPEATSARRDYFTLLVTFLVISLAGFLVVRVLL